MFVLPRSNQQNIRLCPEGLVQLTGMTYPSPMQTPSGDVVLLLYVDDIRCSCETRLADKMQNAQKTHYAVAVQVSHEAGDEIDFLKRKHALISSTEMVIRPHPKRLSKIFELLGIRATLKR